MASGRGVLVVWLMALACGAVQPLAGQEKPAAPAKPATPAAPAKPATPAQADAACSADVVKRLAGTWRAPQYRMKRASEVGVQVFGANAFDVRDVELTLQASGEGLLKISTSVVDEKKKTWAPTQVDAKVTIAAGEMTAGRCAPEVKVVSAQEQYLDDTKYQAPIEGARVQLLVDAKATQLDLRFETPEGEGSFWTTMRRAAK